MKIYNTSDIGSLVREKRKSLGLSQPQLADMSGNGVRFISDIENGKPTMQIGKILDLLLLLGLDVAIIERGEQL